MSSLPSDGIDYVAEADRAARLLHPLRLEILRLAREPLSATQLAARLKLSRQRTNYHVRQLARRGFLRRAGRRRRRNMIEQLYVTSATGFVLSPELLGRLGADWRRIADTASPAYLVAVSCQMQSDLIRGWRESSKAGEQLPAVTIKSQFRFESPGEREAFTRALREAVIEVIARHTSPNTRPDRSPAPGHSYRLVIGCYPYAPERSGGD